jgi:lipopolysaccharide transport system permease protein
MADATPTVRASSGGSITCFEPPSIGALRPLRQLARLRRFSDLLITLSVHRISVRYKQTRLGILWAILQPLALMLVFGLMFSFLGGAPSRDVPYAVFAYAGLLPWTAFSTGLSTSSSALTSHGALLAKVAFPREILPLTYAVAALVDLAIGSTVLATLMIWYRVPVTATSLWAVAALAVLSMLLVGTGLLVSALHVRHRDVGLAIPVVLQVWMFLTPVLYPLLAAKHALSPAVYRVYILNPMTGVVETFRRGLVLQQAPDFGALAVSGLIAATLLPAAYLYFKFSELTVADVV